MLYSFIGIRGDTGVSGDKPKERARIKRAFTPARARVGSRSIRRKRDHHDGSERPSREGPFPDDGLLIGLRHRRIDSRQSSRLSRMGTRESGVVLACLSGAPQEQFKSARSDRLRGHQNDFDETPRERQKRADEAYPIV